jgi:hypothetical protein
MNRTVECTAVKSLDKSKNYMIIKTKRKKFFDMRVLCWAQLKEWAEIIYADKVGDWRFVKTNKLLIHNYYYKRDTEWAEIDNKCDMDTVFVIDVLEREKVDEPKVEFKDVDVIYVPDIWRIKTKQGELLFRGGCDELKKWADEKGFTEDEKNEPAFKKIFYEPKYYCLTVGYKRCRGNKVLAFFKGTREQLNELMDEKGWEIGLISSHGTGKNSKDTNIVGKFIKEKNRQYFKPAYLFTQEDEVIDDE